MTSLITRNIKKILFVKILFLWLIGNLQAQPEWDSNITRDALNTGLTAWTNTSEIGFSALHTGKAMNYLALIAYYNPQNTTVVNRLLQHIRNVISGGREPMCRGVIAGWSDNSLAQTLALTRNNSSVWNQLSKTEQEKCEWLMRGLTIAGNYCQNYRNDPRRGLYQSFDWSKSWNPNHQEGYVGVMIAAWFYYGGADNVNNILTNFNYDTYISKYRELGFTNIVNCWAKSGKELMEEGGVDAGGGRVYGVKIPFTFQGASRNEIPYDPVQIYTDLAKKIYRFNVKNEGCNGDAYITDGSSSPYLGQKGMCTEFESSDGGGCRSSARYAYDGWMNNILTSATLQASNYSIDDEIKSLRDVGSNDLIYKLVHGYSGRSLGKYATHYERSVEDLGYYFCKDIYQKLLENEVSSKPANQNPVISITSPTNNEQFENNTNISIEVSATDTDGSIEKVEFYEGNNKIGESSSEPFTFIWQNVSTGQYDITARATDNNGATTNSNSIEIIVAAIENQVPDISLMSPKQGDTFIVDSDIIIEAEATDTDGTVEKVIFRINGNPVDEDTEAPFSCTWKTNQSGNYTIDAIVYDNTGNTKTSTSVGVTCESNNTEEEEEPVEEPANVVIARINAGETTNGDEFTDNEGNVWSLDHDYESGNIYPSSPLNNAIANTNNDFLYQTERSGSNGWEYQIPVPENGTYRLNLHFAEIWWTIGTSSGGTGYRIFDIEAEGNVILDNYDILSKVAGATAIIETVDVEVTDGILNLKGIPIVDQAKIAAIEVIKIGESDITNPPIVESSNFTLINASSDEDIKNIINAEKIALSQLPSKELNIRYNASESNVRSVVFILNGKTIRTESTAPYAVFGNKRDDYFDWIPTPGTYVLTAREYSERRGNGTVLKEETVSFEIVNTMSENFAISYPYDGSEIETSKEVTISANVPNQSNGRVKDVTVSFYVNGNKVGEATQYPYQIKWSTFTKGDYTITASMENNNMLNITPEVNVTAIKLTNLLPEIDWMNTMGNIYEYTKNVTLETSVTDKDGKVKKVQFYNGDKLLAEINKVPYTFEWIAPDPGIYEITAHAFDDDGDISVSEPLSFTVLLPNGDMPAIASVDKDGNPLEEVIEEDKTISFDIDFGPNPVSSFLKIKPDYNAEGVLNINAISIEGKRIELLQGIYQPDAIIELGLHHLKKGLYIIEVQLDEQKKSFKVIKQ